MLPPGHAATIRKEQHASLLEDIAHMGFDIEDATKTLKYISEVRGLWSDQEMNSLALLVTSTVKEGAPATPARPKKNEPHSAAAVALGKLPH